MKGIAATESSTENDRRQMTEEEETRQRRKESPFDMKGRRGNNAEWKGKNCCREESLQESPFACREESLQELPFACREESLQESPFACREESLARRGKLWFNKVRISLTFLIQENKREKLSITSK